MKNGDAVKGAADRGLMSARAWLACLVALAFSSGPANADRIENGVAVFSALDKVTATIKKLEVPINETVQFGALKVTPRVCYSRPPTEQPKTTTFVEVTELMLDGQERKLFSGWMFAESPGLNAVEHPVFDVWLTECRNPKRTLVQKGPEAGGSGAEPDLNAERPADDNTLDGIPRRRVRR